MLDDAGHDVLKGSNRIVVLLDNRLEHTIAGPERCWSDHPRMCRLQSKDRKNKQEAGRAANLPYG